MTEKWIRAGGVIIVIVLLVGLGAPPAAGSQPPPAGQQEFVPVDQLPQAESLPAAPLVIGAYGFVWIALLAYLWSVRRRLNGVERELASMARRVSSPDRSA